jgi:outer membrane protein TolC
VGGFVNWNLFDGGKMFITKKRLSELQAFGELQLKDKVMATIYDVVTAYYDIIRQKQQLNSVQEAIKYNTERVKISQVRFDAGLSAKTDLLQAKIDLNGFREGVVTQQVVILNSKRRLNQLLNRDIESPLEVADSVTFNYKFDKRSATQKLSNTNTSILSSQKQVEVANLVIKENKTNFLPRLSVYGGYNYARSDNSAGFTLYSQTYGPQVGGTLNIPLYQAGTVRRSVEIARIQLKSAEYGLEKVKLQATIQLQNAITDYENQQQLYTIEKESADLSKENIDISAARLRLGQANTLEARQAELNYQNSLSKLSNIQYTLKVAETRVRQLLADF